MDNDINMLNKSRFLKESKSKLTVANKVNVVVNCYVQLITRITMLTG